MVEFEKRALYFFTNVLKNPKMHWSNSYEYIMLEFMYAQVTNKTLDIVFITNYAVFSPYM